MHYVEFDEANDRIAIARAYVRPGARTIVGSYAYGPYDWIGPVFRRGECLVVDDVHTSPVIPDAARPAMSAFPVRAFISAPLVKDGHLVAALSASVEVPRTWSPDECGLVQETAERTWAAVERARAEAALKQANDALEQRVLDRTAQLATSNQALEREVREHRLAELQITALFRRLISTQEEERRRIARDIHDQVGQQMTALRLRLEALRAGAGGDPAMGAQVEGAQRLAEELDQSIDFLTSQLRPSTLDNLGLAVSLRDLVHGWAKRFGIPAEFEASAPEMRLADDVETNLYRIAQEALHNVVKHAQARNVSVLLSRRDSHAMLVIEDDGRGFETGAGGAAERQRLRPGQHAGARDAGRRRAGDRFDSRLRHVDFRARAAARPGARCRGRLASPTGGSADSGLVGAAAQGIEREAARAQDRHELTDRLRGMAPVGLRIPMMAVVDDDDVPGRRLARQPSGDAIGARPAPPVPVPHAPAPASQAIASLRHPGVHRSAAPPGVRPEQPARRPAGDGFDAIGGRGQARGQRLGRHHHQAPRPAVQGNRVSLVGHAPDDRRGLRRDVLVDQEERRPRVGVAQRVEQRRRPRRVRSVVERQVERRRKSRPRGDVPEGFRRAKRLEQEREGRGVREDDHRPDEHDDQADHRHMVEHGRGPPGARRCGAMWLSFRAASRPPSNQPGNIPAEEEAAPVAGVPQWHRRLDVSHHRVSGGGSPAT